MKTSDLFKTERGPYKYAFCFHLNLKLMKHFLLLASIAGILLSSCRKEEESISNLAYGRVLHINSNTPVPNALVRLLGYELNESSIGGTSVLIATDTTDENGIFVIPAGLRPATARAYGLLSQYTTESEEVQVTQDHTNGVKILYLYLIPKAWIRISAIDEEPLDPEVQYATADLEPSGTGGGFSILYETPRILEVSGNIPYSQYYQLWYLDGTTGPVFRLPDIIPRELDTTDVVIHY